MHKSVLLQQAIEGLGIQEGDTFLDCTVGGAGHSLEVCSRWGEKVKIVGLDLDKDALERSRSALEISNCNFVLREGNFRDLDIILAELKIKKVNRILMDLGWSSDQLEASGRGFSFMRDEPLLMTLKKEIKETDLVAKDILNSWEEENIYWILKEYGEEKFSRRIAKKIIEKREGKLFETTFDLVAAINEAVPGFYKRGKIHPATRTFQALRIVVNDELGVLKDGLEKGFRSLGKGGSMAVISFHSLEDRIVKNFFRDLKNNGLAETLTKKPVTPDREEVLRNPRSRSAKLRITYKK